MDGLNLMIAAELERIRKETDSDFTAFAAPRRDESSWRWTYASGSLNGRYALLAVKPGRGIVGAALRTERVIVLDRHRHALDLRKEDSPLLMAERLEAVAAVPVLLPNGPQGVLLLGARSPMDYDSASIEKLYESAKRLSSVFSQAADNPSVS
ncbi:GAF domain-containing protein [Paenibacillus filicis]|uniref:GAF domain-containing protein n=1 Tax=Paenibacillus gyeongsangnamensis TaxID=3388067 RepID=A0ABT4QJ61_9BACL|nr:GAF domain-containing protein [Paenibacillus filicis]MCZ8516730.1 GAF domain-containing protein [Paenibacillus filicis]